MGGGGASPKNIEHFLIIFLAISLNYKRFVSIFLKTIRLNPNGSGFESSYLCELGAHAKRMGRNAEESSYMTEEHGYMMEEHGYMTEECGYMTEECGSMAEFHWRRWGSSLLGLRTLDPPLSPHQHQRDFPVDMSAKSHSSISPNASEVISEVMLCLGQLLKITPFVNQNIA